jgi:hypothetical protein
MERLSTRMLQAGWVVSPAENKQWHARSPRSREFRHSETGWDPPEAELMRELIQNEADIRAGNISRYFGASRLTGSTVDQLAVWMAREGRVRQLSVLRVRVDADPSGDDALYAAGARRVDTLSLPWPAAEENARVFPFHLLLGEHVLDVLPPGDRRRLLGRLQGYLRPDAVAVFSFFTAAALPEKRKRESHEDGYVMACGLHEVFLKPYLQSEAQTELRNAWKGYAETLHAAPLEFYCRWNPHD